MLLRSWYEGNKRQKPSPICDENMANEKRYDVEQAMIRICDCISADTDPEGRRGTGMWTYWLLFRTFGGARYIHVLEQIEIVSHDNASMVNIVGTQRCFRFVCYGSSLQYSKSPVYLVVRFSTE